MDSNCKNCRELEFKIDLLINCLMELFEKMQESDPNYKSRSYELLACDFTKNESYQLDKLLFDCVKNKTVLTKKEFINKVNAIRNGRELKESLIVKLLEAYKYENLFLPVIENILTE